MSIRDIQEALYNDDFRFFFNKITVGDGHCWYHSICDLLRLERYQVGTSDEILSYVTDEKLFKLKLFEYIDQLELEKDEEFLDLKNAYVAAVGVDGQSNELVWDRFLNRVRRPHEWACDVILNFTSWFIRRTFCLVYFGNTFSEFFFTYSKKSSV